jgi:hypothetical protein
MRLLRKSRILDNLKFNPAAVFFQNQSLAGTTGRKICRTIRKTISGGTMP